MTASWLANELEALLQQLAGSIETEEAAYSVLPALATVSAAACQFQAAEHSTEDLGTLRRCA